MSPVLRISNLDGKNAGDDRPERPLSRRPDRTGRPIQPQYPCAAAIRLGSRSLPTIDLHFEKTALTAGLVIHAKPFIAGSLVNIVDELILVMLCAQIVSLRALMSNCATQR
jgi:hypothetical protein